MAKIFRLNFILSHSLSGCMTYITTKCKCLGKIRSNCFKPQQSSLLLPVIRAQLQGNCKTRLDCRANQWSIKNHVLNIMVTAIFLFWFFLCTQNSTGIIGSSLFTGAVYIKNLARKTMNIELIWKALHESENKAILHG